MTTHTNKTTAYFAAAGMALLVLFVLIVPIYMDLRGMPRGKDAVPEHPVAIAAWPLWPDSLRKLTRSQPPPELEKLYKQMAHFANQSAYPMYMLERTIGDVKAGRATTNDLYEAARAEAHADEDERDALMGLVLPPELRSNRNVQDAWKSAQLAALAKRTAMSSIVDESVKIEKVQGETAPVGSSLPWQTPAYLAALRDAREKTTDALNSMMMSAQRKTTGG
ncbi:MAG: hypothetical protein M3Y56_00060 [Armatimonadota bacterium]|nr:hypothetical protein [Armatimonadota bacterium]